MFPSIKKRLQAIHTQIIDAARQFGRDPGDIQVLAVSKNQPKSKIEAALSVGQIHFGENYLQEATQKINSLQQHHIIWHYIGQIQSNKCKKIAYLFDWVHCIECAKMAQSLNGFRANDRPLLNVCLQVNISNEPTKGGLKNIDEVHELALAMQNMPKLSLRGLMTIATTGADYDQQRHDFHQLRLMFEQLRYEIPTLDTLSMGMSNDYPAAIAEGATFIRLGTAIFGGRPNLPTH
jgi:PLP dependent protein